MKTERKCCLNPEVAENLSHILQSTPALVLPAPFEFRVDDFSLQVWMSVPLVPVELNVGFPKGQF